MSAIHGRMVRTLNVESHGMNKHSIDMYLLRLYRKGYSYAVIQSNMKQARESVLFLLQALRRSSVKLDTCVKFNTEC